MARWRSSRLSVTIKIATLAFIIILAFAIGMECGILMAIRIPAITTATIKSELHTSESALNIWLPCVIDKS